MLSRRPVRLITLFLLAIAPLALSACAKGWKVSQFPTTDALYAETMRQFRARKWDRAIAGFERLSQTLPARDPRMPVVLFHLAQSHERKGEHILAATTFTRVSESFPDDTLADDAIYQAGRSYSRLWRKPSFDPTYGETALNTFQTLLSIYPNSDLRDDAQQQIDKLHEWFAEKAFENGMHYYRRKAYESSLIYFNDVVQQYPQTPTAKDAMLQLVRAYRRINYQAEIRETCGELRQKYPNDGDVNELCSGVPSETPKSTVATPTP